MDPLDRMLREFFTVTPPPGLAARALERPPRPDVALERLVSRLDLEATEAGVCRLTVGRGRTRATGRARRHAEAARAQLAEYLAGRRAFFTVPVDLAGAGPFQRAVLAMADRIPYGATDSYSALAARVGRPRAARAVGNALAANPVPILLPCHRVVRGDGTWGHYAFGGRLKTRLLALERATPAIVGCSTTRIVCRHGCRAEQRIREPRRVVFASVAEAGEVGYRPCRLCAPGEAPQAPPSAAQASVSSRRRSES